MRSIKAILAFVIMACGAWLIVQSLTPQITAMIGGAWYIMLLVGIVMIVAAGYVSRR